MDPVDPALQPVIVLRVVIKSPDLDTFVSKYSRFIKDDRIFIFTKSSQPPGTRVRFTLELADGQPLIHGEGTVTRIRPDSGDATKPPGMELRFLPLDEASRALVERMLRARDSVTGQLSAVVDAPKPPPLPSQFREETTDAQTNVRDSAAASTVPREFDESVPTLAPLEKTGSMPAMSEPSSRQNESGAVTLAHGPLDGASNKQSGGFSTPTPLPAPIPAASDEFGGSPPPTKLARPSPNDSGAAASFVDSAEPAFASAGPAPMFAEAFRAPIPGAPPPLPPTGTVPANPFSEISDGAIEYFVEWSLEQSTAPKPKVAEAQFANVTMATPRAAKRRSMRGPLLGGMAIGIFLGLPLGGAIVWFGRSLPAPVIVEKMPEPTTPPAIASQDLALARVEAPADLAASVAAVADKPAKVQPGELSIVTRPAGAAVSVDGEPHGKTPLVVTLPAGTHEIAVARERYATVTQPVDVPGKLDLTLKRPIATLHVDSEPAGGEVIVEGKPRGKTPVDVTLDAFHHYDVQVMLLGTKPWHKRVSLKPPQTDVTAKLSVVHNP
ncbi:MAG TPA: PEGA domain-containing protein [Polyangia bacterium]|nr:PEGA domain-containing protein [Polyangia bacterium]